MTKDINAIEGILESLEDITLAAANVMDDGKVDMNDLPVAIGLLSKINEMIGNFKKIGEAFGEAKDIDAEEAIVIVGKLYDLGKKVEEALRKEEA